MHRAAKLIAITTSAALALTPLGCQSPTRPAAYKATPAALAPTSDSTTIILVRHAHRGTSTTDPRNPPLTTEGQEQARLLEWVTRDAGLNQVLTSDATRTRQTAQPTASARTLILKEGGDFSQDANPSDVADTILAAAKPGTTTLVVSHSHHIPDLLKSIGGWTAPDYRALPEPDTYRFIFIITIHPNGTKSLIRAGYPPAAAMTK